jgi:hypothetical protein
MTLGRMILRRVKHSGKMTFSTMPHGRIMLGRSMLSRMIISRTALKGIPMSRITISRMTIISETLRHCDELQLAV